MGVNMDSDVPEVIAKGHETESISVSLAEFILGHCNMPAGSMLAIDEESGLIAINCTIYSSSISLFDPLSCRRIYRLKAPVTVNDDLASMVQTIFCGGLANKGSGRVNLSGVVDKMILWTSKALALCSIAARRNVLVLSLLTGSPVAELCGHLSPLSALTLNAAGGLVYSGGSDCTVRVWRTDECIQHKLAVVGAVEDRSTGRMEERVTRIVALGPSARQVLKTLCTVLCARLNIVPKWRMGVIHAFFDGANFLSEPFQENHAAGVEVLFEDSSTHIYSNHVLLRDPKEVALAPRAPLVVG